MYSLNVSMNTLIHDPDYIKYYISMKHMVFSNVKINVYYILYKYKVFFFAMFTVKSLVFRE